MGFKDRVTERIPKSSDVNLLPCPFCGSEDAVLEKHYCRVTCPKCGVTTSKRGSITIAVGIWNKRANTASTQTAGMLPPETDTVKSERPGDDREPS